MKNNYSSQGLSQIIEESDREDFEHPRRQLAKLNNLEFLNQYVHLSALSQISQQYQHLLWAPLNENYQRFSFDHEEAARRAHNQLQQNLLKIERAQHVVLSKDELKTLAAKKMQQTQSRQRLSTSRRQKRDQYYELLKTSRRFNFERLDKSSYQNQSIERVESVMKLENLQSPVKDISTQQTIEDLFLRLQKVGEQRDIIKKQWYSWGEKSGKAEKEALIDSWTKTHRFLKQLLEEALSKVSEEVGSPQIFRQLRIESTSILFAKRDKSKRQKTMGSTAILSQPSPQQTKLIVRFNQWFNKLLLDERQLQFIKSQHLHLKRV